jgi:hypothetical protein
MPITQIPFFNYLAFFILYIGCFYFIYKKNTEILGIEVLTVINGIFMIYLIGNIMEQLKKTSNITLLFNVFAVIITIFFHFIALILVLMTLGNMNSKYLTATGLPINLPHPYSDNLTQFYQTMITCFLFCTIILTLVINNPTSIKTFTDIQKLLDVTKLSENKYTWLNIVLSIITLILSSFQISFANDFSSLARKQLINTDTTESSPAAELTSSQMQAADLLAKQTIELSKMEGQHITNIFSYINDMPERAVDLSIFLPPITDQGNIDSCGFYSMVYYIGNYYQMKKALKLDRITNANYIQLFDDNQAQINEYYSDPTKVLNPLYNWVRLTECNSSDTGIDPTTSFANVAVCETYANYILDYNNPFFDGTTIVGCDSPGTTTISPFASTIPDSNKFVISSSTIIDTIKNALNAGNPVFWATYLTPNFTTKFTNGYGANAKVFPEISVNAVWYTPSTAQESDENYQPDQTDGHTMVIVGYIDGIDTPDDSAGVFKFANQWGTKFGDKGYGYITYNMFKSNSGPNKVFNQSSPYVGPYVWVLPPSSI